MTKRKENLLERRYRGYWRTSEYAKPSDSALPPDLADILQFYRGMAFRLADTPNRSDVVGALKRLAAMAPGEARKFWRYPWIISPNGPQTIPTRLICCIEPAIQVEIKRVSTFSQGDKAPYSHGVLYFKKGPENIPRLAETALQTMRQDKGGRPPIAAITLMLAEALALYWWRTMGKVPKAYVSPESRSPFMEWATPLLERAGFKTGDAPAILRKAVRNVKKHRHG